MNEELARLIGHRLIARKDVKALQTPDRGYERRKRQFTMKNMHEHIEGTRSWGHYLLDTDSTTKIFAFDIDVDKEYRHVVTNESDPEFERMWFILQTMADGLGQRAHRSAIEMGVDCTIAVSYGGGKGLHVIGIFDEPLPASASRSLAEAILGSFNCPRAHDRGLPQADGGQPWQLRESHETTSGRQRQDRKRRLFRAPRSVAGPR